MAHWPPRSDTRAGAPRYIGRAYVCIPNRRFPMPQDLSPLDIDRIIEMAWEDRTPFDAIEAQFGVGEAEVIRLMRAELKPASWRRWRARVQGRATKHAARSAVDDARFRSAAQRTITGNRRSKR